MLISKEITNIYLWEYTPTPSTIVLFDDDFTTMSNSQLIAQWFESVGQAYGLTTSSNWLHRVTFETDTHSWIEYPLTQSLAWRTINWDMEWYNGNFDRWWSIELFLDWKVTNPNSSKKYNWWTKAYRYTWLTWLPWENQWSWSYQWSWVPTWVICYYPWDSSWNSYYRWSPNQDVNWYCYTDRYCLNLPFTTWTYKFKWSFDFKTWQFTNTWTLPDWSTKTFNRDLSWIDSTALANFTTWLWQSEKYLRFKSNRWYWSSSYDVHYWRKAKIRIS